MGIRDITAMVTDRRLKYAPPRHASTLRVFGIWYPAAAQSEIGIVAIVSSLALLRAPLPGRVELLHIE